MIGQTVQQTGELSGSFRTGDQFIRRKENFGHNNAFFNLCFSPAKIIGQNHEIVKSAMRNPNALRVLAGQERNVHPFTPSDVVSL